MKIREYQYWLVFIFATIRLASLGLLGYWDIIDPRFFTYQNFILDTFLLVLLSISLWERWALELFLLLLYPLYWGTAGFVSFAIVVILHLNGSLFTKTTPENGGTNDIGKVHTGDYELHQWPFVEVLLLTLVIWPHLLPAFSRFYESLSTAGKVGYVFYFHLVSLGVLLLYMLNFDFLGNYPTALPSWVIIALVAALAILVQGVLFGLLYWQHESKQKVL